MDVVSLCPLPAACLFWEKAPSRWALTVVCKATFRLEPGTLALAPEQEPLFHEERHRDDDPGRSLLSPSDMVPVKARAEVVLVGHAHARNGQPVRSLVVRLNVGRVDKSIEVVAPRSVTPAGEIREGKRWTKMPIVYERAAGGPGTDNPVGIWPGGPRDAQGEWRLPTLQPPGFPLTGADLPPPIGFGPIAAGWPQRGDEAPAGDFDAARFQAAPPDQQIEAIRPNERITLENLHPRHARLVTRLPGLLPFARIEPRDEPAREIHLAPDTLWIDTRRAICTLTFRGHVEALHPEQEGRIVVTTITLPEGASVPGGKTAKVPLDRTAPLPPVVAPAPPPVPVSPPPREWPSPAPAHSPDWHSPTAPPVAPPPLLSSPSWPAPAVAPPPLLVPLPADGSFSALEASNAAAGIRETPAPEPAAQPGPAAQAEAARPERAPSALPVIELLWLDAAAPRRLSRHPAFASHDGEAATDTKPEPDPAAALRARARVHDALVRGPLSSSAALEPALDAALEAGDERPPAPAVVLVSGTLEICLDEAELLRATVFAASPLGTSDRKLKEALDLAAEVLKAPMPGAPDFLDSITTRIRDAWTRANRLLPPEHLAACTEGLLLERRAYQKRELMGETWIRALLCGPGWDPALVVYLPASIVKSLPLYRRFAARVLGELLWQQDQYESHPLALRALALGRVARARPRHRRSPAAAVR